MPKRPKKPTWVPSAQDYRQVFDDQNPWHATGKLPEEFSLPTERPLAQVLWKRLAAYDPPRFQLILGPRRVGKTVSMHQTVRHLLAEGVRPDQLWWFRLDHPLLLNVDLGDLVKQLLGQTERGEPVYLFLDEVTYAREWDLWLKTFYDDKWAVRVCATSSSIAAMRERRIESGIGRWEEQYLAPYLFDEFLDLKGIEHDVRMEECLSATLLCLAREKKIHPHLEKFRQAFVVTGGFPELLESIDHTALENPTRILSSQRTLRADAVDRVVYKDIPQVFGVDDPIMLERVLYTLAGQLTGILSPTSICANLPNLSLPTFDRYVSYLERAFLVFLLPNYSGSEKSLQKRGRKLYFVDGAVRNAALQRGLRPLGDPAEMGLLIENLSAGHLHALAQQTQVRLHYWREKTDEVDLIYDDPQGPLAFEIGTSPAHSRAGLVALASRHPRFRGQCYLIAPGASPRAPSASLDEVGTLSLETFLAAVGAHAARALRTRLGSTAGGPGAP